MGLTVISGKRGMGKSVLLTRKLYYDAKRGYRIYANYVLRFPYQAISLDEMMTHDLDLQNASIGIDEAQLYFDCRCSGTKRNRIFSYIMLQSRKRHCNITLCTQQLGNVDLRIERNMDYWDICTALVYDETGRYLRPATAEDTDAHHIDAIKVDLYDMGSESHKQMIFNPKPWFKFFDSDEFQTL